MNTTTTPAAPPRKSRFSTMSSSSTVPVAAPVTAMKKTGAPMTAAAWAWANAGSDEKDGVSDGDTEADMTREARRARRLEMRLLLREVRLCRVSRLMHF